MDELIALIATIRQDSTCEVYAPAGLPTLYDGQVTPNEILTFYTECGGMFLHVDSSLPIHIFRPEFVREANSVCLSSLSRSEITESLGEDHISWNWYVFAESDELIAISIGGSDQGNCYDCYWENYPNPNRRLAFSLTEFLRRVYDAKGEMHIEEIFNLE